MDYKLITTASEATKAVSDLLESRHLGFDTETTSLTPRTGKLRLMQFSDGEEKNYIIDLFKLENPGIVKLFKPVLESRTTKKIVHNNKFDAGWIQETLDCEIECVFDSYIAQKLLDVRVDAKLSDLLLKYNGIQISKELQKSDWSGTLSEAHYQYALGDVIHMPKLRAKMLPELELLGDLEAAKIEFECTRAVSKMENVGFPLDIDMYRNLIEVITARRNTRKKELEDLLNSALGITPIVQGGLFGEQDDKIKGGINLNSPKQLLSAFQAMGLEIDSTNKLVVEVLVRKYPELEYLTRYRAEQILVTAFGDKMLGMIDEITKRIHATFWQLKTVTARFSCSNPNLQQMPKTKEFRECFRPKEGRKFVIADYGGMELRILAQMSMDKVMLNAFNNNGDLHSLTAKKAFNLSCDVADIKTKYPKQRDFAKALNFGIIYGMGAGKYANKVNIPMADAKRAIKGFYETYPEARNYLYGIEEIGLQQRHVRSFSGRKMNLYFDPSDEIQISGARRDARNYPIQSSCADIMKIAIANLHNKLKPYDANLVNIVHDEILIESSEKDAEEVKHILESEMIAAAAVYMPDVKIEAEAKVCNDWSEK